MKHTQRQMVFRKEHSRQEIIQYILDPDAPPLHLSVKLWYEVLKWIWVTLNVLSTLAACGALVWLSYPQFVESTANSSLSEMNFLTITELICVIFFSVDYVLRFMFTDLSRTEFITDPANIIDALTTVPYYFQMVLASADVQTELFRVFFIFRMVRVIRLAKYHPGLQLILQTVRSSSDILALFVVIIVLTIIVLSTGFYFSERTTYDPDLKVWMRRCLPVYEKRTETGTVIPQRNCTEEPSPYQSIPESMYWAVVTLTTIGHSIETPTTVLGKIIASVTALIGVFFFAAPATVLATNYKLNRQAKDNAKIATKMDQRATMAMKAQEDLRKELERVYTLKDNSGRVKFEEKRVLTQVAAFEYRNVTHPIFYVSTGEMFVYPPLVYFQRDEDGDVAFTDDFNVQTAQRIVTCCLQLDDEEARTLARMALVNGGYVSPDTLDNEILVCADPQCSIQIYHEFSHIYPNLGKVVYLDQLQEYQSNSSQDRLPITFVVPLPHMQSVEDVIELLRQTRLTISLGIRMKSSLMHIPLHVANIMASRFIRELFAIAHERKSDGNMIAYIHPNDASLLLVGFCDQFIPTPSPEVLIVSPHLVDRQVFLALRSSFPLVRLEYLTPEAANSYYRSHHLNADGTEERLLSVNLTQLSMFDELGYGHRFKIHVPVCEENRVEIQHEIR